MPLVEHLEELRRRVIRCAVAVAIGMIAGYLCYQPWILNIIKGPLDALASGTENPFAFSSPLTEFLKSRSPATAAQGFELHFMGAMEPFAVKLKASLFAGILLTSPYILYQVWSFIAAGLRTDEQRSIRTFLPSSIVLFLAGVMFAYCIMIPVGLYFLVVQMGQGLVPMLTLSKHASLVVWFSLTFGVVFQMPIVIFFLVRLGIVSPRSLARKRRHAILIMFIVGAILTPPEAVTQIMVAVPMMILYEISILLSKVAYSRRQRALEAEEE